MIADATGLTLSKISQFLIGVKGNVIASPLVVYLDTQDYIRIFNELDGGPAHDILDQLLVFRDQGEIVIGYSWVIMLEFITRPTDDFRAERVRRGQLVKDICGRNAFPFLSDLKHGARFPNDGIWMPSLDVESITAKSFRSEMKKQYFEAIAEQHCINRKERRRLKSPPAMRQFFRDTASTLGTKREDFMGFPVSDEFIDSRILSRLLIGQCSDAEFEESIYRWFYDPTEFSRITYDYANKPNLLDEFFGPSLSQLENVFRQIHATNYGLDEIDETIRKNRQSLIDLGVDKRSAKKLTKLALRPAMDPADVIHNIEGHIGAGRADHIGHYIIKASRKDHNIKRSDFMDVFQMCYVPDCDLFRCDKAMADLYRGYEPFDGKLVAKFTDLPARIEAQISARNE